MTLFKTISSALLALSLCSSVTAQVSGQVVIPPALALPNCAPGVSCGGVDIEVVTSYIGEPVYITRNITKVSTQTHTTTSTIVVPTVTTVTSVSRGICNIVTTKVVTTPLTIPVTQTVVSIEHRADVKVETSVHTITATVEQTSACIQSIKNDVTFTAAAEAPTNPPEITIGEARPSGDFEP